MDKPLPKPLAASTWNHTHLAKLQAAALALGGAPEKEPTDEEGRAFAEEVPFKHAHVASARYNRDHKRVEVTLHGGALTFHVPVVGSAVEEKAPPTPKNTGSRAEA